jgi:outer membrane protein TolC
MKGKEPIRMKFPFPGVLALKGQIVNQRVLAERESLETARRNAVTAVRMAYWDLVYAIQATRITADMLELLKNLEAVAETRYEAGKTNYQDVVKVRINRETIEEDLITLKEKQRNIESKIREVINLPPEIDLGPPKMIPPRENMPALGRLYDIARKRRQELRRLRTMVGKTERMIEMAETMILPPYTLNFSLYEDEAANMVGAAAEKNPFPIRTEAATGAGLPKMPWFGTEDAYLRETRQSLYALREALKKAEVSTHTMVRIAWFELDRARRETALYSDDVVALSRSALDVSTRGYESGNVSFADVIDSYTTWLRANLMLERNRSDLGIAWARLEQVIGVSQ